ncbi:glutamine-hydrolyzing carbamoyl-phosphate synthase small subunit [Desulfonatronum thioautotrophicum]|uniref:glutamine-hydrolyzing carbamoyl-phosphate synthase small subunit n=1 Tax=Desulfonatronum thioautotrophicum TaxID=617001 RepID=UPI0005EB9DA6|nr:glutamine-hydrolyzing carbamoyl-phosphate synthase small subunit [Desulfonatronum thioautotrophicum]
MRALLALEDGTCFTGRSFTGEGEAGGEVIFNTGMTGYQEVLTDPSYIGQMVCMTYPLMGNYGVNLEDVESDRVQVEAMIVKECCKQPSNWQATQSLPDYLRDAGVIGLEGIDTRALTRHLRIHGAKRGIISTRNVPARELVEQAQALPSMEGANLVQRVSVPGPYVWDGARPKPVNLEGDFSWTGQGYRVVVFDYGIKWSILRILQEKGLDLLMVPSTFTAEQVLALQPDAVFLGNGPGDPAAVTETIQTVTELSEVLPMAGICLGQQIMGLALGGATYKLKFGHHGLNHPVKELATGRVEISSQNHGFCVDFGQADFYEPTHINLNDNTLEGFRHKTKPLMAVQHHPEAGPGPHDCRSFFDRFVSMLDDEVGKR